MTDGIAREIVIDTPLQTAWSLVTEARHLRHWFSDEAEVDLRPGGSMTLGWHGHGSYSGRVVAVEPPHLFSFRWIRREGIDVEDASTLVTFVLTEEGASTRVRVEEHGFHLLTWSSAEIEAHQSENHVGWERELRELQAYAGSLVDSSST